MKRVKKFPGWAMTKTMNAMIDIHDKSRTQLTHQRILSGDNASGLRYHDAFSSECFDIYHWYEEQKTCEWISSVSFIDTWKSGGDDWGNKSDDHSK